MKIAVLIPCYNAGRFLAACLDSVLNQTVPVEIFACDDGSGDDTAAILEEYANRFPNVSFRSHANRGVSFTRNVLLDGLPAGFDAVGFVDSDDWVEPTMFEKLSSAMEREEADVVDCGMWSNGVVKAPNWINVVNKLYRRSAIGNVRFRAGLAFEEDNFFNREVNRNVRKRAQVDEPLYHYRENPDSATGALNMRRYVDSVTERVRLTLEVFGPSAELAKDAYRMMIRKNLKNNRDRGERRELFRLAGERLSGFRERYGFVPAGLNPVQRAVYLACVGRRYALARVLAFLT